MLTQLPDFTCAHCGGTFAQSSTNEETETEYTELFHDQAIAERETLCHICWLSFMVYVQRIRSINLRSGTWIRVPIKI